MPHELLSFRASPGLKARLTELSESKGLNRSATIKSLVLEATVRPDELVVASDEELLRLLTESARAGNVAAMKELRVYHRERKSLEQSRDTVDDLDELAVRRSA